jgi:AcrR family transcriptional regulator
MTTTKPALRADAERNRLRILAAARRIFSERGLDVTLDDVAREAGVGVATVYRRFTDREDLIEQVFEQALVEVGDVATAALADEDPWRALVHLLEGTNELFASDRGLREVFFNATRGHRGVASIRAELTPLAESVLRRAQSAGAVRADVATTDLALLLHMLGAIADKSRAVSPDLWRRYLGVMLEGLREHGEPTLPLPGKPLTNDQFSALLSARC